MGSFFLAGKAFGTGKHPKGKAIDKGICQRTDAGISNIHMISGTQGLST